MLSSAWFLPLGARRWSQALVLAVAMATLFVAGCATRTAGPPAEPVYASADVRAEAHRAVLEQAWRMIEKRFYAADFNGADWSTAFERHAPAAAAAPDTAALYAVINAMLDELNDAHTTAMSPRESWEDTVAERAFVGVNLERVEDRWVVSELRPGSDAAEAGVQAGWVAVARNGEPLPEEGITFRSEPGVGYEWTFLDEHDVERRVTLTARTLSDRMPPVERHSAEGWIYLRFDEFEPDYHEWLRERLEVHRQAPGVVLDLRQNSGGAVSSLARILNDFFPRRVAYGSFVSRQGRAEEEKSAWRSGVGYDGALAVLIGPGSASSAEILAHVLRHYDRAKLIGRPTAGVVVASQYFRLRDGGELQIGTYDYQSLDGQRLERNGVQPDVVVPRTLAELRAGRDPDLEAAVEWLRAQALPLPAAHW